MNELTHILNGLNPTKQNTCKPRREVSIRSNKKSQVNVNKGSLMLNFKTMNYG